jgi:Uma2 family endonuclease
MAVATRISEKAYEQLVLSDPDRKWELRDGVLREKPAMTFDHNWIALKLAHSLLNQLDWSIFQARVNAGRPYRPGATYFIPDVFVLPTALAASLMHRPDVLEVYDQPLPLVVEIWSPSTGNYDLTEKLAVYRQRGDLEIWFIHPYERTLTAWRRLPDGNYETTMFLEGSVSPIALPGVVIDLAALYEQ